MPKVLVLMTKASTLTLLDGEEHASGFWAEEFVVPYEQFIGAGYHVDVATIGGEPPTADPASVTPRTVGLTKPAGDDRDDRPAVAHYRRVLAATPQLTAPLDTAGITREQLASYHGVYICGGHGAIEDMPHDRAMTRLVRWLLELGKPLAVVCHGQSALLPLRDSHGQWPLAGYRMTAFSHQEELATDLAGRLPFVLQVELERLGARYQRAPAVWDSCVVEDRNLLTGQNPYSSTALASAFVKRLDRPV
jgi:putative intracellular protease/amidase